MIAMLVVEFLKQYFRPWLFAIAILILAMVGNAAAIAEYKPPEDQKPPGGNTTSSSQ
jgi:hypothetical protein